MGSALVYKIAAAGRHVVHMAAAYKSKKSNIHEEDLVEPMSPHGEPKLIFERILQGRRNIHSTGLRLFNVVCIPSLSGIHTQPFSPSILFMNLIRVVALIQRAKREL